MLHRFDPFLASATDAVSSDDVFTVRGFKWSITETNSPRQSLGVLQVICEVVKSGPEQTIRKAAPQLLALAEADLLTKNMLLRKYKTKLVARVALRLLPPLSRRKGTSCVYLSTEAKS